MLILLIHSFVNHLFIDYWFINNNNYYNYNTVHFRRWWRGGKMRSDSYLLWWNGMGISRESCSRIASQHLLHYTLPPRPSTSDDHHEFGTEHTDCPFTKGSESLDSRIQFDLTRLDLFLSLSLSLSLHLLHHRSVVPNYIFTKTGQWMTIWR